MIPASLLSTGYDHFELHGRMMATFCKLVFFILTLLVLYYIAVIGDGRLSSNLTILPSAVPVIAVVVFACNRPTIRLQSGLWEIQPHGPHRHWRYLRCPFYTWMHTSYFAVIDRWPDYFVRFYLNTLQGNIHGWWSIRRHGVSQPGMTVPGFPNRNRWRLFLAFRWNDSRQHRRVSCN